MVNNTTRPMANFIADVYQILPPHMVSNQLKIFTPVGIAIAIVAMENTATDTGPRPDANMWCAHTPKPTRPIDAPENTTNGYPNNGLRENVGRTSEIIPKAGRINTYTSGCPKIQNKCCHNSGSAPCATSKNVAPYERWNMRSTRATVITGSEKTSKNCTTKIIQVNTGIFMKDMPGARMLRTVTIRLMEPINDATPATCKPMIQKSTPLLGEKMGPEFGAYMNQPPSAAPPRNHDALRTIPPTTSSQSDSAFKRGNATSRAPICSGKK